MTVWGLGFVQNFEAAAMDVYIGYRHFENDLSLSTSEGDVLKTGTKDFDAVRGGVIIRF